MTEPNGDASPIGSNESGNILLNRYAAGIRTTKIDMTALSGA